MFFGSPKTYVNARYDQGLRVQRAAPNTRGVFVELLLVRKNIAVADGEKDG